jgi:hypothetical protein
VLALADDARFRKVSEALDISQPALTKSPPDLGRNRLMRSFALGVVALGCSLLLAGCRGSSGTPGKPAGVGRDAAASIVGKWASSTSPQAASSRTTMAFLESGEYQYNSPMILFGKPVTADVEGKEVAARVIMSGLWELDGDQLRVRIT